LDHANDLWIARRPGDCLFDRPDKPAVSHTFDDQSLTRPTTVKPDLSRKNRDPNPALLAGPRSASYARQQPDGDETGPVRRPSQAVSETTVNSIEERDGLGRPSYHEARKSPVRYSPTSRFATFISHIAFFVQVWNARLPRR
jgi:hypothetical protein